MVPPVNYKCKCGNWCGSRLYLPQNDEVIFKCGVCLRTISVPGSYFLDTVEEYDLFSGGAEFLDEFSQDVEK